jgi:hypothetical protein
MRHYPTNSPQAAARILALALLSDGHLSKVELDVLDRLDAHGQLGMRQSELHQVVHGFCEDLLATSTGGWADVCRIDAATLTGLLADIDAPDLRLKLLRLSLAIIASDQHLAEGESLLLEAAVTHWDLQADLLQNLKPSTAELVA